MRNGKQILGARNAWRCGMATVRNDDEQWQDEDDQVGASVRMCVCVCVCVFLSVLCVRVCAEGEGWWW